MTEVRCFRCWHWHSEDDNPEAVEREFQMRFGPEVAPVGTCVHPTLDGVTPGSSCIANAYSSNQGAPRHWCSRSRRWS